MSARSDAAEARSTASPERLAELARSESTTVRVAVANNPAIDDDDLLHLVEDPDETVASNAASIARGRPGLHAALAGSGYKWARAILAHTYALEETRNLEYAVQRVLAADSFWETRLRVAETTNHFDIFEMLLTDEAVRIRGSCAANPRISREQMERLITDRSAKVRSAAAALGIRYPDEEQILRLAEDRSVQVHWAVLTRVDTPRRALEMIAGMDDEMNVQHARNALLDRLNSDEMKQTVRERRRRLRDWDPQFESPPPG